MIRHRAARWLVAAASGLTLIGCQQGANDLSAPSNADAVAVVTAAPAPKFAKLYATSAPELSPSTTASTSTSTSTSTTTAAPDPVPAEMVAPWQPPTTTTTTTTTTTAPPPPRPTAPEPSRKVRVAAAAPQAAAATPAAPAPAPPIDSGGAAEITALTNSVRASAGLPPLQRDGSLDAMAASWAKELASSGRLRHSNIPSRIVGKPWSTAGENVGYGPSVGVVHNALVKSSGHYANITGASFTRLGVGVAIDGAGQVWVVEVFAG